MSRTEPITFDQLLDSVPVRNEATEAEQVGRDELRIRVPFRKRWYMTPPVTWILPLGRCRTMRLDKLGREVWEMVNGRDRTEAIIERFADRYQISFHEARLSVTQFLQVLTRNDAIVVTAGRKKVDAE